MSDTPETLPEGINPEDFEWALGHLKKIDEIYKRKLAEGERSMVVGMIDPIYDEAVVEKDSSVPCGYRLIGRASILFTLLQQSVDVKIERMEFADVMNLVKGDPFSPQFHSLSPAKERYKGRQYLCGFRLVFLATW